MKCALYRSVIQSHVWTDMGLQEAQLKYKGRVPVHIYQSAHVNMNTVVFHFYISNHPKKNEINIKH